MPSFSHRESNLILPLTPYVNSARAQFIDDWMALELHPTDAFKWLRDMGAHPYSDRTYLRSGSDLRDEVKAIVGGASQPTPELCAIVAMLRERKEQTLIDFPIKWTTRSDGEGWVAHSRGFGLELWKPDRPDRVTWALDIRSLDSKGRDPDRTKGEREPGVLRRNAPLLVDCAVVRDRRMRRVADYDDWD